jgi:hypothetical protein
MEKLESQFGKDFEKILKDEELSEIERTGKYIIKKDRFYSFELLKRLYVYFPYLIQPSELEPYLKAHQFIKVNRKKEIDEKELITNYVIGIKKENPTQFLYVLKIENDCTAGICKLEVWVDDEETKNEALRIIKSYLSKK